MSCWDNGEDKQKEIPGSMFDSALKQIVWVYALPITKL